MMINTITNAKPITVAPVSKKFTTYLNGISSIQKLIGKMIKTTNEKTNSPLKKRFQERLSSSSEKQMCAEKAARAAKINFTISKKSSCSIHFMILNYYFMFLAYLKCSNVRFLLFFTMIHSDSNK